MLSLEFNSNKTLINKEKYFKTWTRRQNKTMLRFHEYIFSKKKLFLYLINIAISFQYQEVQKSSGQI